MTKRYNNNTRNHVFCYRTKCSADNNLGYKNGYFLPKRFSNGLNVQQFYNVFSNANQIQNKVNDADN